MGDIFLAIFIIVILLGIIGNIFVKEEKKPETFSDPKTFSFREKNLKHLVIQKHSVLEKKK